MSFVLDLQKFAEKTAEKADLAVGRSVIGVHKELDERSPVGDAVYWQHPAPKGYIGGHFRGNWQLGVGMIPAGEIPGADPTGAEATGRILAAMPEKASGNVFYLWNNAPYGRRIEEGWSRQAPQGLVGLTVIRWQAIVDEAAASLAA
jgi:hypothetical protein